MFFAVSDFVYCSVYYQIKVENSSQPIIFKGLAPRIILSNHFRAQGNKSNVNLAEKGRQKVSFSFNQTKKPLQNFFLPTSPEKAVPDVPPSVKLGISSPPNSSWQGAESNTEPVDGPPVTTVTPESQPTQIPVSLPPKPKPDLGKVHFKKQLLSLSDQEEASPVTAGSEETLTEADTLISSVTIHGNENSQSDLCQTAVPESPEKTTLEESAEQKIDTCLKGPTDSSHIGKEYKDCSGISEPDENKTTQNQPDSTQAGAEVDGNTVLTSSSQKSSDSKNVLKSDSQSAAVKKSSTSKPDVSEKSRSDRKEERDEKGSGRSKNDRDSRNTSSWSSRSDRRRTRSRSRSRSRSSRTSSSYSRSERARNERQSRSDRSHYHDSERRCHRSSRERRRSRERGDHRSRDSSDSEEDLKKHRTRGNDSSRSSTYSSSRRDFNSSSHSKSYRDPKSTVSSESDKRTLYVRSGRSGDSEPSKRSSSEPEAAQKRSSTYLKSTESHRTSNQDNSSRSERTLHRTSVSSDSDEEHRNKSHPQSSDKSSRTPTKKALVSEGTSLTNVAKTEEEIVANFSSNAKLTPFGCDKPVLKENENKTDVLSLHDSSTLKLTNHSSPQRQQDNLKDALNSPKTEFQDIKHETDGTKCLTIPDVDISHVSVIESNQHGKLTACVVQNPIRLLEESESKSFAPSSLKESSCPVSFSSKNSSISLTDTLSVKEVPPSGCMKSNTKFVSQLFLSNEVSERPTISNVETLHVVSEQRINPVQLKREGRVTRRSRWDIVGQEPSESQSPQMTNQDPVSVRTVIPVKNLEFNDEMNLKERESVTDLSEGVDLLDNETTDSLKETKGVVPSTHTCHEGNDFPACQAVEGPIKQNCFYDASVLKDQKHPSYNLLNDADRAKPEERDHSEESESDDSESDSDDDHESLKRLHSVVVVPQKSTLSLETSDHPTQSTSTHTSGHLFPQDESSKGLHRDVSVHINTQTKSDESLAGGCKSAASDSFSVPLPYQSQSNTVDSTSHSDPSSLQGQENRSSTVQEAPKVSALNDQAFELRHNQYHHKPDSWHERKGQQNTPSGPEDYRTQNGFNVVADFTQAEQPSSTFQQPDSSHNIQPLFQTESGFIGQGVAYWHRTTTSDECRPTFNNSHLSSQYHDSAVQIHPDSMTNDSEEDHHGKALRLGGAVLPTAELPASSTFVQAHEISSNCSFVTATTESKISSQPSREDHLKAYRCRGPPKKRRPELESESDNEAEAGLASKRVRPEQESVRRPTLSLKDFSDAAVWRDKSKQKTMPPYFDLIEENLYLSKR